MSFFSLYVWTINGAMAHMRTSSSCHYDQEFETSLFTHPETTTSQSPGKISWKHSSWERNGFVLPHLRAGDMCCDGQVSVCQQAYLPPSFILNMKVIPTQFDMSKVWCCGSRLAALLFLSEPITGSERVADQKHSIHILTDSFVARGDFLSFFSLPAETDLTWYVLHLSFTRKSKNPKVSSPTAVTTDFGHNTIWTISIK